MTDEEAPLGPRCDACTGLTAPLSSQTREELETWTREAEQETTTEAVLRRATAGLVGLANADRSSVLLPFGRDSLRILASSESRSVGDLVISLDRYPELAHVLRSRDPLLIPDVTSNELLRPVRHLFEQAGTVSIAAVPVRLSGVTAVLRIVSQTRPFVPHDLNLLRAAAHFLEHALSATQIDGEPDESWQQLAIGMADMIVDVALDGRIVAVHGPAHERLGLDPTALQGTYLGDHLPEVDAEYALHRFLELLEGPAPGRRAMYTVCLPDQPPASFMISGARCDRPMPRARLALRRVDASVPSLEHLLTELPVPLLMIDPRTTTMLAVNRAAERLSGCVATDLLGNPLDTLVTGLDANARLHRPGGRSVPVQIIRSCDDQTATGPTAVALLDQRPYSDGHRREAAMRTTLTRQMEELELLRKQLDEVSGVRTQFLSAAAHELKTPLTVVQSYLEILLSDMTQGLGRDQLSFLRIAYDSVLRLRHLVVDLVDLAALESGRLQLDICRIDVGQLLAATTDEMKPLADRAGLQLERGGAAPLPSIRGDRDRVQQVLRNLVDNAIKNTPAGGRIAVDVHADQDTVVLTVEDSGVGIPGDELASIFDEFVQVRRGPDDRPRGTGLGLAICRRIVRALGGRITVDSSEDRGSVFAVHLPMWPQEDHE